MTSPQPHHPGDQRGSADEPVPAPPDAAGSTEDTELSEGRGSSEDGNFDDALDAAPSRGIGQSWRLAVAGAELLVVAALVLLTWWAWGRGTVLVDVPGPVGAAGEQDGVQRVTRSVGNWQAASIGAAALAGLVALDLFRQLWLSPGPRRGR